MGPVTFATKLRIGIFGVVTLSVVFAISGLSIGLFVHTEAHIKANLIAVTNVIINDKLRVSDGEIRQKEVIDGHTLGVELRAKDLSALIVHSNGEILARYGIYRDIEGDELKLEQTEGKYEDKYIKGYGLFDTYTVPIKADKEVFGYMRIVRKNNELQIIRDTIGSVILFVLPISWIFAYLFSYILVRRITKPLRLLVKHLENVDPASMQTIRESVKMDHEVRVVTRSINTLIERLRENLKRERQITENISHEFKTPLTRIASNLQVGKYHEAEQEILELGGNVDALLSLAIWDNTKAVTDLVPIIKHLVKLVPADLKLDVNFPEKILTPLPSAHLTIILRNLMDNAIKHNKKNGNIKLFADSNGDKWKFEISNTINHQVDIRKITERKYKSGPHAGYGIGMSIVDEMCNMHDLTFEKEERDGEMVVRIGS